MENICEELSIKMACGNSNTKYFIFGLNPPIRGRQVMVDDRVNYYTKTIHMVKLRKWIHGHP